MSEGPGLLNFDAVLASSGIADATGAAMAACRGVPGLSALLGWRVGDSGPVRTAGLPDAAVSIVTIVFAAEGEDGIVMPANEPGQFIFGLTWSGGETGAREALAGMTTIAGALAALNLLRRATVKRHLGGHCLPVLPLLGDAAHLLACTRAEVEEAFAGPEQFAAAWDSVEHRGGIDLCTRAADALGNPAFLRSVLPQHMALARIARPGRAELFPPSFAEGEFDLLNAGEPTLSPVGYHAATQVYEFSGHTPPGTELRCIDLFTAWQIASDHRLPDGRPVREVRAVFMDEEQARRAGPLLQAAGVIPYWEDQSGTLRQLAP